jgi:hypothetical protein
MGPPCQSRLLNREQNLALRADRRQQSAWLVLTIDNPEDVVASLS